MTHYKYNTTSCKMDCDSDAVVENTGMEQHQRYMRLHAIVEEIKSGPVTRTSDWYVEHNHLLCQYDSYFKSGFSDLHEEITNLEFRKNCKTLDFLINKLMREFTQYSWFSLYEYMQFNVIAIQVVDYVHDVWGEMQTEEDELSELFSSCTV